MIVFILNPERRSLMARKTQEAVILAAPGWRVILLEDEISESMNRILSEEEDMTPFFLTFQAGEWLAHSFPLELEQWLKELGELDAGICLTDEPASSRGPIVWRRAAVLAAGGFASRDWLPFSSCILLEMMGRLSVQWGWREFSTLLWSPSLHPQLPAWRREYEEKLRIIPLLTIAQEINLTASPLFSIVICSYNAADSILWSIRSVLAQRGASWELIILDDGSVDETSAKLKGLPHDSRIRIIRNESNSGKAHCLNQAMSIAQGEWLLELDADDWLDSHCLERFSKAIAEEAVATTEPCGCFYGNHDEWLERYEGSLLFHRSIASMPEFIAEQLLDQAAPLAPRLYRLDALKSIGGWWESGSFGGRLYEDFQILIRLSRSFPLRHVPHALYHRRLRSTSVTRINQDHYSVWRDWFRTLLPDKS